MKQQNKKLLNSRVDRHRVSKAMKIYHCVPKNSHSDSVSRNLPKSSIFKSVKLTQNSNWLKKPKNSQISFWHFL